MIPIRPEIFVNFVLKIFIETVGSATLDYSIVCAPDLDFNYTKTEIIINIRVDSEQADHI